LAADMARSYIGLVPGLFTVYIKIGKEAYKTIIKM
jgi:hypothetical protein